MNGNDHTGTTAYRLSRFVITITDGGIIASEYIYYQKEDTLREIEHPAVIDREKQLLIIQMNWLQGKDAGFGLDEYMEFFRNLPEWTMTRYYQLRDQRNNYKYITETNSLIEYSTTQMEILK